MGCQNTPRVDEVERWSRERQIDEAAREKKEEIAMLRKEVFKLKEKIKELENHER